MQENAEEAGALQVGEGLVPEADEKSLVGALFQRVLDVAHLGGTVERAPVDGFLQVIQAFKTAAEEMIETKVTASKGDDGSVMARNSAAIYGPY